jgi:pepF/M3 family oligoendopeptidase
MTSSIAIDRTWDLTPYFPSLASPEFCTALDRFLMDTSELASRFSDLPAGNGSQFEATFTKLDRLRETGYLLGAYISCQLTADSFDADAQRAHGRFGQGRADLSKANTLYTAWVGTLDLAALMNSSQVAKEHEHSLKRAQFRSKRLMTPQAEAVSSDLSISGSESWDKLYSDFTSQMTVAVPGQPEALSMSGVRNLAYNADPSVRRAGYEAEHAAWRANSVPIAAALNSIKGASLTLCKHRGWGSPLNAALFWSAIDQSTLDAMNEACEEAFPILRRYLRAKAKALGLPKLAFHDMFAPFGSEDGTWEYDRAERFVADQFDRYSPKMGDFARRAYAERWIDVMPRRGKVGGAYCQDFRHGESRILMNFKPSYNQVSTLAHELGHGYHALCLKETTTFQRDLPMTLAETASTFCETIVRRAALDEVGDAEALSILEAGLQGATQVVIDIASRFKFESAVFARRAEGELTTDDFTELMLDAQKETYGDGLDQDRLHGFMWAAKPHYYGSDFYNFPYTFGLLFGLGLYAVYSAEPNGFAERYDRLLSRTGMADAAILADEFGINVRTTEFWRASLSEIGDDVNRFCSLVGG